jgi:G3E family GTPase
VKNDINSKLLRTPLELNSKQSECFLCSDGAHNRQIEHDHSSHHRNHSFEHSDHLLKFRNWSLNSEKPIDKKLFKQWLASLYSLYPLSILRLKGFVNFENNEGQYLIQAVGPIITEIKLNDANRQTSSLVFIFKDIEIKKLQKSYEMQVLHPQHT